MSAGRRVARNSLWYGMEVALGALVTLGTSVLMSRIFGPERLAPFTYLVWMTYVAGTLATVGLPGATQKYMTEYLGKNQPGMAYRIFWMGFKAQLILVGVALPIGVGLVWFLLPPDQRWMGIWLVVGMAPRMLGFVVSQINAAIEDMSLNLPAAVLANLTSVLVTVAAIWLGWGLTGVAAAQPVGHTADLIAKLFITRRTRRAWQAAGVPPPDRELNGRIRRFAFQGIGLALLAVVVWDRSDLVLLKHLHPDAAQVTFFSYAYTQVEKLLLITQVVGSAMGFNLLKQYGRDHRRVASLAVASGSYLLLIGLPVLLGAVALSRPVWMIYGDAFAPAVPVFIVMALLATPRLVLWPVQSLLQATENQSFLVKWGCVCGAVNIGLDWWLIPAHGAMGAAIGNGIGQSMAAVGGWAFVVRRFGPDLGARRLASIVLSGGVMCAAAAACTLWLPPLPGAAVGVVTGIAVYLGMLRVTRALSQEDRDRFLSLVSTVPAALSYPCRRILWSVIPQA